VTIASAAKLATVGVFSVAASAVSYAERIPNPLAMFAGLDKITAETSSFEVRVGEEVSYGSLSVNVSACYTNPITERPQTSAFVQVFTDAQSGERERIFSGWMFAESPGLNALENPVYDIWLTGCRDPNAPPVPVEAAPETKAPDANTQEDEPED
jgi:hypothetical protein